MSNTLKEYGRTETRIWFESDFFDVYVFLKGNVMIGFQLCYDRGGSEHVYVWNNEGVSHYSVDHGQKAPGRDASPIFRPSENSLPKDYVVKRFQQESAGIDKGVVSFIVEKLR